MRQFILGAKVAYASAVPLTVNGEVGFSYLKDGVETLITTSNLTEVPKRINLHYYRGKELGQVLFPIYLNNFSYSKSVYAAATKFTANVTVGDPTVESDYTIIVVKKGIKFNERNKWTATVRSKNGSTADSIGEELAKTINYNSIGSGVTAENASGTITITAKEDGVDYEIVPADALFGVEVTPTAGIPAVNDAKAIKDMMEKAAADAGIEYTYIDNDIYPNYPPNPLAQPNAADVGYTVYTLKFAEPREMKTVDKAVNQIIQIAFPTGSDAITTMDTILASFAG